MKESSFQKRLQDSINVCKCELNMDELCQMDQYVVYPRDEKSRATDNEESGSMVLLMLMMILVFMMYAQGKFSR